MPWRRSIRRQLLGAGVGLGAIGSLSAAVRRAGAVQRPTIFSCSDWGARPPSSPVTVDQHGANTIVVHHTALANSTDYSKEHAFTNSRDIQDLHMDTNGWLDTGQHFTISRGGWMTEGRHGSLDALDGGTTMIQGAHCVGQNDQGIGIENEGSYLDQQPPDALWQALITLCAYICQQYGIDPAEIYGHQDFNSTQCPGLIEGRLAELRTSVAGSVS